MTDLTDDELVERVACYLVQLIDQSSDDPSREQLRQNFQRLTGLTQGAEDKLEQQAPRRVSARSCPDDNTTEDLASAPHAGALDDHTLSLQVAKYILSHSAHHYRHGSLVNLPPRPNPGAGNRRLPALPADLRRLTKRLEQIVVMDAFRLKNSRRFQKLTKQEVEVLKLLAEGHNNPAIAERLFISRQTVETHRKRIKAKLDIQNYRQLVKYALAFDLLRF